MKKTISCNGKLIDLSVPKVMGIINVTPDSFFDGGRYENEDSILQKAQEHFDAGATFLDVGAASSRPGATTLNAEQELERLEPALESLMRHFPECLISVDTFHAPVARRALELGAAMVNDIGAGNMDASMFELIATANVPYIMMHMQGTPATMQHAPYYKDAVADIITFFSEKVASLKAQGVKDLVLDPGFGFGKTLEHNYQLLHALERLQVFQLPILAGISRKRMIYCPLATDPDHALNGTSAAHMLLLERGANILRVHDAQEAQECISIWKTMKDLNEEVLSI